MLTTVSTLGDFTFYTATCSTAWLCSLTASVPIVFTHTLYFRILITTHTCPVGIPISNILLLGRSASPSRFLIPSLPHTCSFISAAAAAKSLQSCPALCDPIDSSPTRLLCPWDPPGKSTGVGCHCLLRSFISRPCLFLSVHFPLLSLPYFLPDPVQTRVTIQLLHCLDLQQPSLSAFPLGSNDQEKQMQRWDSSPWT